MEESKPVHLLEIRGQDLVPEKVAEVAYGRSGVFIADAARQRMEASFSLVKSILASGKPTYGISTGFGDLSRVTISESQNYELQRNLIRSHASGVGRPFPKEVVRAMMVLRLNALCVGYSGINPQLADLLASLINEDIIPVIPQQGSLGHQATWPTWPICHLS